MRITDEELDRYEELWKVHPLHSGLVADLKDARAALRKIRDEAETADWDEVINRIEAIALATLGEKK